MFNKFNSFRLFDVLGNTSAYNPYINYSWSQTLTVGTNQEIKDTGKSGLNLQQYFGQGVYFNGVDQNITIPVNATIQTEIKRVDGVTTVNTNTQVLTDYSVYSGTGGKIIKDLYMFNRVLTQVEIDKYNNQPNQFFMDSLEDSSCVVSMPMCEKDAYVRNYKSYSYSSFLINNIGLISSTHSGTRIAQLNAGLLVQAGKTYLIKYSFIGNANITNFKVYIPPTSNGGTAIAVEIPATNTNNGVIVTIPTTYTTAADGFYCWLVVNGTSISVNFDEASIREISGIYPITNYTAPSRTYAQRLPYGLQTSGFKRDTLGMILSKSNFLEADGVGYGNTGWIPSQLPDEETIEIIFQLTKQVGFKKLLCVNASNAFMVQNLNGTHNHRIYYRGVTNAVTTQPENDYVHVVMTCNSTTSYVYINGVKSAQAPKISMTTNALLFFVNTSLGDTSISPIRLFKVHQKVLTEEEVTKNFNIYTAQGLLSESGEFIPNNAITDADGNYFVDENGNYIVVNN